MLPPTAAALGLHSGFLHLGLADTELGVVLSHLVPALPYTVSAIAATFSGFDARYEAVARNLGASRLRVFTSVTLPVLLFGLASGGDLHLTAAACVAFLVPVFLLLPVTARALTGSLPGGRG